MIMTINLKTQHLISTIERFCWIFSTIASIPKPEFGIWRAWTKESYNADPPPEINPLWTAYQRLPVKFQAFCLKPDHYVQNREERIAEPIDEPDLDNYGYSNEVPVNKSFLAQGTVGYENDYLDASQEGRYLREYCVQRAGANQFLHLKTVTDLKSVPQHQDPCWIAEQLDIEYDLAYQLVDATKRLDFDRKWFLKAYYGNKATLGLKDMDLDQLISAIETFVEWADGSDTVTVTWDNYINSADVEKEYLSQYMEDIDRRTINALLVEGHEENQWDESWNAYLSVEDNLDRKNSTNPYSTNRLHNGKDALSWEFQRMVETADLVALTKLKDGMFPRKRSGKEIWDIAMYFKNTYGTVPEPYSSRKRWDVAKQKEVSAVSTGLLYDRPKFHYFTQPMKSHFWTLYKARKAELANVTVPEDQLSEDAKVAIGWIKSMGKGQTTCGMIYAAVDGRKFNVFGIDINFSKPLKAQETNTLWATYRAL